MNVNVIDNQLLESLNNYFNTLSKTGYIKNSNSEALLVLSFLQEITSDYTDLVTFLNSLSENYCIIPFLDLSTCKVDLNSSDQLVRFTANLDNVSAYINTSYLDNQLINFPYMAITGKSIQINDILAPFSPQDNGGPYSVPSHNSGYYIYDMTLDGMPFSTDWHNISKYPLTTSIDHKVNEHNIEISLRRLPYYNLYAIVDQDIIQSGKTWGNRERIITLRGYSSNNQSVQFGEDEFTISTHSKPIITAGSNRYMLQEEVYLGAYIPPFNGSGEAKDEDIHLAFTSSSEIKNDILLSSLYSYEPSYDLSLFTDSSIHEFPVFLYGLDISSEEEVELANGKLYSFNKVVSSNNNWVILEHDAPKGPNTFRIHSGGDLTSFTPYSCQDGDYHPGLSTLVLEWNQVSNIALATNFIIPTTREDESAETLLEDGLSISDIRRVGTACMDYMIADKFSNFGIKSKPLLLWSGKAFVDTIFDVDFSSPEGTTLDISTATINGYETTDFVHDILSISIIPNGTIKNKSTVRISCGKKTSFFTKAYLKIGGHIQYNTTTVNITGNISGMSVNIEGEGTVSLPATIQVNKP